MVKQQVTRQRVRMGLLIGMFLLFPIIMNYFSPYIIIDGASQGIVNGSLIVFGLMFISALFVGRLWCGWTCPMGALQEFTTAANNGRFRTGKRDWIKWFIWLPWIGIIVAAAIAAGGYHAVDPFLDTTNGVSVAYSADNPFGYTTYYLVIGIFFALALLAGRRAGCHTICWMAPLMILGRKLRNLGRWPSLRLVAAPAQCADCKKCTTNCPMSLDVNAMVHRGSMEHNECILCGTCVDNCSKGAIRYSFCAGR